MNQRKKFIWPSVVSRLESPLVTCTASVPEGVEHAPRVRAQVVQEMCDDTDWSFGLLHGVRLLDPGAGSETALSPG
jgi:hypothetical protein